MISLNLAYNNLTQLPAEIGKLTNLRDLYLGTNYFSVNENNRIRALLPNCEIDFYNDDDDDYNDNDDAYTAYWNTE